jgi:ABC-type phosphate transport system substrate-binding protein
VQDYQGAGAEPILLNGLSATFGHIGRTAQSYPYWTVEYFYTYGRPAGLASAFLSYLNSPAAQSDLRAAGYTPCQDAHGLCAQNGS